MPNEPEYFEDLFNIHAEIGFSENLPRLVEATNKIVPFGSKFSISDIALEAILNAPSRASEFIQSSEYNRLKSDLDLRVSRVTDAIVAASLIENVNVRGRLIESMITSEHEESTKKLVDAVIRSDGEISKFRTSNELGDYTRVFDRFETATDVKTKIMVLNSNPKAYNIDKLLEFLSKDKSVFMFYFIGIEPDKIINQVMVSMFQEDLMNSTIILRHWAGRNSRGVTQFQGSTINKLILSPNNYVNRPASRDFLQKLIRL